jgi:hypothetical protein
MADPLLVVIKCSAKCSRTSQECFNRIQSELKKKIPNIRVEQHRGTCDEFKVDYCMKRYFYKNTEHESYPNEEDIERIVYKIYREFKNITNGQSQHQQIQQTGGPKPKAPLKWGQQYYRYYYQQQQQQQPQQQQRYNYPYYYYNNGGCSGGG